MKIIISLFTACFLLTQNSGFCQKPFVRGTVEIFDKYEMSLKRIGGNNETFRMSIIRRTNQTAKDTVVGVNIEIETTKKSELISSSGFTITSNFDFAISSSKTTIKENKTGTMLLSTKDFISLIDFFNETIAIKSRGPEPEYDMGWQLEIEERFWLALLYEKSVTYKWKYYLKLDDAEFELPYESAIDLFKKLSTFKKRINEGLK